MIQIVLRKVLNKSPTALKLLMALAFLRYKILNYKVQEFYFDVEEFCHAKKICYFLQPQNAKSRKDLLAILSQKNTKEETEFLKKLIK